MVNVVDITQNKQIKFLIAALISLGGLAAFLAWMDNKKHEKLKGEIMELEKNIKLLQLEKLKNGKS